MGRGDEFTNRRSCARSGSAVVGEAAMAVICGVKGEFLAFKRLHLLVKKWKTLKRNIKIRCIRKLQTTEAMGTRGQPTAPPTEAEQKGRFPARKRRIFCFLPETTSLIVCYSIISLKQRKMSMETPGNLHSHPCSFRVYRQLR